MNIPPPEQAFLRHEAEIHLLSTRRDDLRGQIENLRNHAFAELYCESNGRRSYLTHDEWSTAVATLDQLSHIEKAGFESDSMIWSLSIGSAKHFLSRATKFLVDHVIPERSLLSCPPSSSPASYDRRTETVRADPTISSPLYTYYNNWRISSTEELLFLAEDPKTSKDDSNPEDGGMGAFKATLVCISHTDSDDGDHWPRQCLVPSDAVVHYLKAIDATPKIAAIILLQLLVALAASIIAYKLISKSVVAVLFNLKRQRVTRRVLAEVDLLEKVPVFGKDKEMRSNTKGAPPSSCSGNHLRCKASTPQSLQSMMAMSRSSRSPSPSQTRKDVESPRNSEFEGLSFRERYALQSSRDRVGRIRTIANVKMYTACFILMVIVIGTAILGVVIDGDTAVDGCQQKQRQQQNSLASALELGGVLFFVAKGASFLLNSIFAGSSAGTHGEAFSSGFLSITTASSIAVALLFINCCGTFLVAAAVQLLRSAQNNLLDDLYREEVKKIRFFRANTALAAAKSRQ